MPPRAPPPACLPACSAPARVCFVRRNRFTAPWRHGWCTAACRTAATEHKQWRGLYLSLSLFLYSVLEPQQDRSLDRCWGITLKTENQTLLQLFFAIFQKSRGFGIDSEFQKGLALSIKLSSEILNQYFNDLTQSHSFKTKTFFFLIWLVAFFGGWFRKDLRSDWRDW